MTSDGLNDEIDALALRVEQRIVRTRSFFDSLSEFESLTPQAKQLRRFFQKYG